MLDLKQKTYKNTKTHCQKSPKHLMGFVTFLIFVPDIFPKFPSLRLPELIDSWARTSQVMARKLAKLDAQLQRSFGDICGGVVGAGGFRK